MFESAAMLIHIALAHRGSWPMPKSGHSSQALFLQWMVFLSANVYESALRMYYSARYSARGELDAEAVRAQGSADFCTHLELIGRNLAPYVLGAEYSVADSYLSMLASWYPGERSELFIRIPELQAHAKLVSARPAVAKVEADHAQ
jgi:GST-like protein